MLEISAMPWHPHRLRDTDVWARVDVDGAIVQDSEGRVEIIYKAESGAKVYRAGARNLGRLPGATVDVAAGEAAAPSAPKKSEVPANAIHVWTDGACSGNPGPAGLGVVVVDGAETREISEYLGEATNNIAELTAILRGLSSVAVEHRKDRPVIVYSDSAYSIGLLSQNWKAKANVELVAALRAVTKTFKDLRFVKVLAHSGIPLNERVDQLATGAVSRRR
ncbi:MAG: ribonuclease HI [Proteobacteria bacterium]|nr:ribonuclease HI [Pseudomonadota bacterium]